MKFNILGFNQEELIKMDMDTSDVLILRYLVDFIDSGSMITEKVKEDIFYWIDYSSLIENLPILGLKKDGVYRRLKKMVNKGVLKHYTKKVGGTFSFYALGEKFKNLLNKGKEVKSKRNSKKIISFSKNQSRSNLRNITLNSENENIRSSKNVTSNSKNENMRSSKNITSYNNIQDIRSFNNVTSNYKQNIRGSERIPAEYIESETSEGTNFNRGYGVKNDESAEYKSEGLGKETQTKDNTNKNNSIKNYTNKEIIYISEKVIEYLNKEANKNYKKDDKKAISLIMELLNKGFTKEDLFRVIENKTFQWNNTEFHKYLRPSTLFGDNFYRYVEEDIELKGFNNFKPRNYDYEKLEWQLLGWS
ncbi:hypothetical protein JCM1393_07260 [Clostridium carnis]